MDDSDDIAPEARVYRHDAPAGDPSLSFGDPELIDDITSHLEKHLGPVNVVYHELVSEYAHIDVHHFSPTRDRDFHVLATSGMSERPMTLPDSIPDDRRFAELLINLPLSWQLSESAFKDERCYWPVRLIKTLARFPHVYSTWLGYAHTVPNGDPPQPYAASTTLCGAMLVPPLSLPDEIHKLPRPNGQLIRFWNILPLHAEEMELKVKKGSDKLFEHFDAAGVADIVDPDRPPVVNSKGWWPF